MSPYVSVGRVKNEQPVTSPDQQDVLYGTLNVVVNE